MSLFHTAEKSNTHTFGSGDRRASIIRETEGLPSTLSTQPSSPSVEASSPHGPSSHDHSAHITELDGGPLGRLTAAALVNDEGRVEMSFKDLHGLPDPSINSTHDTEELDVEDEEKRMDVPPLNVVIQIVGSRGDVQPYIALGLALNACGHRVRIATHPTFRSFVRSYGLEFFSIGGDPEDLMSYMVQNPGLLPGIKTIREGAIGRKRKMIREMLNGCYRSTFEADPGHNGDEPGAAPGPTFAADAIISNPPAFAHVHIAEATGLPVHLSFTMPWSPTTAFHHPLAAITSTSKSSKSNYLSYAAVEILTWKGLSDVINNFRVETLGLPVLTLRTGPGVVERLKLPYTYCWSPSLIPKPPDWKKHIDIAGFYFLDGASSYIPPDDLMKFLASGEPPVYIGFGSIPLTDPDTMTNILFEAVSSIGARAIISSGWAKLGGGGKRAIPENIFIVGNCPHDWLFPRCSAVVHHGGAGTCAIGLRLGKPTIVIPFFGDQPFWGEMCARAGAGPPPIPFKTLTIANLADALRFALSPDAKIAAGRLGESIQCEDGVRQGVDSFHRHLPLRNMRCDLVPTQVAVWWSPEHCLKLGAIAAEVLTDAGIIDMAKLEIHRPKPINSRKEYMDPLSASAGSILTVLSDSADGVTKLFYKPREGLVKLARPPGLGGVTRSLAEGMTNLPSMYGSEVRDTGRVTSARSGIVKAGKGFYYGLADGAMGLARQPYNGHKKEGWVGAVKGGAQGVLDLAVKPVAGTLGLVFHPINGVCMSIQSRRVRKQRAALESNFRNARLLAGIEAISNATPEETNAILDQWPSVVKAIQERRREQSTRVARIHWRRSAHPSIDGPSGSSGDASRQQSRG